MCVCVDVLLSSSSSYIYIYILAVCVRQCVCKCDGAQMCVCVSVCECLVSEESRLYHSVSWKSRCFNQKIINKCGPILIGIILLSNSNTLFKTTEHFYLPKKKNCCHKTELNRIRSTHFEVWFRLIYILYIKMKLKMKMLMFCSSLGIRICCNGR